MQYILNRTAKGIVFKCTNCQKNHIEFNNVNLNLTEKEYREFSCYSHNFDGESIGKRQTIEAFSTAKYASLSSICPFV